MVGKRKVGKQESPPPPPASKCLKSSTGVDGEFEASLSCIMRSCLQKKVGGGEQGAAVLRIEGLLSIRADLALESSST